MYMPRSGRRRRWDGSLRSTPEFHALTPSCGHQHDGSPKRHDITGCCSSTRRRGTRRTCIQTSFIIALAAASLGRTRAQYVEGGSVSMDCDDCSCLGSTDHGTVEVFDKPSSGQRIALVDGTYLEVLETSCGLSIFQVEDTLYELSGVDLGDRVLEVVDMSSDDCVTNSTPSSADCYSGESVVDLSSGLEAELTFCVCKWTEGVSTSYRSSVNAVVRGALEVEIPDEGLIFCLRDEFTTQMTTIIVEGETDYFNFEVAIPGENTSADLSVEDAPSSTAESFVCGEVEPTPSPVAPTPEPTPKLTPEPTPAPTSELTPESTPEPTPEPVLVTTPEPTAEPTLELTPEPIVEPTPKPTAKLTPEPTAGLTPEPTVRTTPEPTAGTTPEPTARITSEPTAGTTPEPAPNPTTAPTAKPAPVATAKPATVSTPAPVPEPTSEPTPEPSSEPDLEPTPEPTTRATLEPTPKPTSEPTSEATPSPVQPPSPTVAPTDAPLVQETPTTPAPLLVATPVPTEVTGGGSPSVAPPGALTLPPSGANDTELGMSTVAPSSAGVDDATTLSPSEAEGDTTGQSGNGLEPTSAPSVAEIDDLECTLPTVNSCTSTTHVSKLNVGVGAFYDPACNTTEAASELVPGCSADSTSLCRTCFFDTPLYIENNPDGEIPDYPDCPCCVLDEYKKDSAANEEGPRCDVTPSPIVTSPSPSSTPLGGAAILPALDFKDAPRRYGGGEGIALAALVLLAIFTFSPFCAK